MKKDNIHFSGFDKRSLDFSFDRTISKELGKELQVIISKYISNSVISVEPIEHIIKKIDDALIEKERNVSLVKELDVYWRLFTDKELIERMNRTIEGIHSSEINIFDYKSLIKYMFTFNEIFIDKKKDIEKVVETMI